MTGTAMSRWDPFRELSSMQNRINQLFQASYPGFPEEGLRTTAWVPPVDIFESPEAIELTLELPGVNKDDVRVSTENNQLTITGERRLPHEDRRENYHRVERSYGTFTRSFTVPSNIDTTNINAQFRDGLLYLTLPKRPESKPRQIKVE